MTPSQQKRVARIKELFANVKVSENKYFAAVTFDNGEDHPLVKERFHVFVGPRGAVRFVDADLLGSAPNSWKVRARLAARDLGFNQATIKAV